MSRTSKPKKEEPKSDPLWANALRCPRHSQLLFTKRIEAIVAGESGYLHLADCAFCPGKWAANWNDMINPHAVGDIRLVPNHHPAFTPAVWAKMLKEKYEWGRSVCYLEPDGRMLTHSEKHPEKSYARYDTDDLVKIASGNQPE